MALPVDMSSGFGVLEYWSVGLTKNSKSQITMTEVSGFSVQVSAFLFLFPETRHLTPKTLRVGAWNLIFLQCSTTPLLQLAVVRRKDA
jgi:hypothetical protein